VRDVNHRVMPNNETAFNNTARSCKARVSITGNFDTADQSGQFLIARAPLDLRLCRQLNAVSQGG
jgi:hypothetical protein